MSYLVLARKYRPKTFTAMVGKEHRHLRSAAQPLFKRPKVLDWWNKRWIQETVDALLDRLVDEEATDLNSELCALLPMATARFRRSPVSFARVMAVPLSRDRSSVSG